MQASFVGHARPTLSRAPWLVLGVALLLTAIATLYVSRTAEEFERMRFDRWVRQNLSHLEDQVDAHITLLRSTAAFFSASTEVTGEDFRNYVARLRLAEFYPGVLGVGYSAYLRPGERETFLLWARAQSKPDFRVWPEDERSEYHAVLYLQPLHEQNERAIGYDMHTEPSRAEAMDRARDTARPAASGRVTLVQDSGGDGAPAFLVYLPVFTTAHVPATVEERRAGLVGFVYIPFRASALLTQVFESDPQRMTEVSVYDSHEVSAESLLFTTIPADQWEREQQRQPRFTRTEIVHVAGRPWTIRLHTTPAFEPPALSRLATPATLASGIVLSLALFGITMVQALASLNAKRSAAELAKSADALRESESRLRMALAAGELFAYTWDIGSDRTTHIGDKEKMLGRAIATAQEYLSVVHPDDRPAVEQAMARAAAGEAPYDIEYRIIDAAGAIHWVRDMAIVDAGPHAGRGPRLVGVCADITRTKQTEHMLRQLNETLEQRVADRTLEAEHRSAQLRALANELTQAEQRERRRLAQVLHDHLQQLLVASLMRLGAIRRKADEKTQLGLDSIDDLIRQAINASRSLTIELSPPVLYDAGLARALEWLARSMKDKHQLAVELDVDPEAPEVNEDLRAFLFQAVRELLFNVVKHGRVKKARITLRRAPADSSAPGHTGEFLAITVADEGPGFDPSILRVRGAKAEHFGLFSIQQRLELLGGRMEVTAPPEHGTTITLYAPVVQQGPAPAHVNEILADLPESDAALVADKLLSAYTITPGHRDVASGAVRVLLADDHEVLRRGLGALLHLQSDIDVIGEAVDGEDVVRRTQELKPDVVVMDVNMPKLDGVEATRRILREQPDVRIIGLSVHETNGMADRMREAGAFAYLTKTDPAEDLLALIRTAANPTPQTPN